MLGVMEAPDLVGGIPFCAWEIGGAIDVIPVGGIVLFEFRKAPGNLHFAEHGEVRGGVGGVRVEEGAVPVEEDAAEDIWTGKLGWHREVSLAQNKKEEGLPQSHRAHRGKERKTRKKGALSAPFS